MEFYNLVCSKMLAFNINYELITKINNIGFEFLFHIYMK